MVKAAPLQVVVRTLHSSPSYASDGELRKLCKPRTSYASYASYASYQAPPKNVLKISPDRNIRKTW